MQSSNSTISLLGGNGVNLENGLIDIIFFFKIYILGTAIFTQFSIFAEPGTNCTILFSSKAISQYFDNILTVPKIFEKNINNEYQLILIFIFNDCGIGEYYLSDYK